MKNCFNSYTLHYDLYIYEFKNIYARYENRRELLFHIPKRCCIINFLLDYNICGFNGIKLINYSIDG